MKENLGIVNVDVLDLSVETSYLTDEVQYKVHEKKKEIKARSLSSSKYAHCFNIISKT